MITVQEAVNLGCTTINKSCPIWMYNYLVNSVNYGGTVNNGGNSGYWSMNSIGNSNAWRITFFGYINNYTLTSLGYSVRAIIEINKDSY